MSNRNGDLPAFPTEDLIEHCGIDGSSGPHYTTVRTGGLTKREQFAMAAMQGLLSAADHGGTWMGLDCAEQAVKEADALLAELERSRGE